MVYIVYSFLSIHKEAAEFELTIRLQTPGSFLKEKTSIDLGLHKIGTVESRRHFLFFSNT